MLSLLLPPPGGSTVWDPGACPGHQWGCLVCVLVVGSSGSVVAGLPHCREPFEGGGFGSVGGDAPVFSDLCSFLSFPCPPDSVK